MSLKHLKHGLKHPSPRRIYIQTGKAGVIMSENAIRKDLGLPEYTEEEVKKKLTGMEPGVYTITDKGVEHVGFYDPDRKDGAYVAQRDEIFTVEEWKMGHRVYHERITEEEYNKLRNDRA